MNIGQLIDQTATQLAEVIRGGPGSGHHGHAGRPGEVGGSAPGDEPNFDELYPYVGDEVGGREIRLPVPNTDSISASFMDYEVLDGIREVKVEDFFNKGEMPYYYSVDKKESTLALAEELKTSNWIEPLIVGVDMTGPHIVEGSHRIDALRELGEETFPAIIVIDRESIVERGGPGSGHFEHEGRPGEVGGSQPGEGTRQGRIGLTFETWQRQSFDEALAASYADAIEEGHGLTPADRITNATWIAPDGRALSQGSNHEETSELALAVVDGIDADDFTISETQVIQAGLIRHTFFAYGQETFVISGTDTLTLDQKRVLQSIMDTRVNQRASVKIPSGRDTELVGLRIFIVEDVPPSIDPISRELEHVDGNQAIKLLGLNRNEWRSSPLGQGLVVSKAPRWTQMGELITETRPAITVKGILRRIFHSRHASPIHPGTGTDQQVHAGDGAGSKPRKGGGDAVVEEGKLSSDNKSNLKTNLLNPTRRISLDDILSEQFDDTIETLKQNMSLDEMEEMKKIATSKMDAGGPHETHYSNLRQALAYAIQEIEDKGPPGEPIPHDDPEFQSLLSSDIAVSETTPSVSAGDAVGPQDRISLHEGPNFYDDEFGADDWGRENFPDYYHPDQFEALTNYKSNTYEAINRYLRGTWPHAKPGWQGTATRVLDEQVSLLDSVMAENATPEDIIAFRGMNLEHVANQGSAIVGSVFTDGGFVSTSLAQEDSLTFAAHKDNGVMARIFVPAGTPAVYMDFDQMRTEVEGDIPVEEELLLNRGLSFKVVAYRTMEECETCEVDEIDLVIMR